MLIRRVARAIDKLTKKRKKKTLEKLVRSDEKALSLPLLQWHRINCRSAEAESEGKLAPRRGN